MKTLLLVKAFVQGTTWFSKGGLQDLKRRDQVWVLPIAGAGVAVGVGTLLFMIVGNYRGLMMIGLQIGRPELVYFTALAAGIALMFLLGIPITISLLYFSRDTQLVLSMPLREWEIVTAKALQLYLYFLPIHAVLFIPAVFVGGAAMGYSAALIVSAIVQLVTAPFVSIGLAVGFVVLLMRIVNLSRLRTVVELVGMVLALGGIIGLQLVLSRSLADGGLTAPDQMLAGIGRMVDRLLAWVPPVAWAARGFLPGEGGRLVLSVVVWSGFFTLVMILIRKQFVKDVGARAEAATRRRRVAVTDLDLSQRSPFRALLHREWSIIASNSTFLFESIGEVLIFPVMLLIVGVVMPQEVRTTMQDALAKVGFKDLVVLGILLLLSLVNSVAATSISREGKQFALSMMLPVQPRTQTAAKLAFQVLLFYPSLIVNMVILMLIVGASPTTVLMCVPGGFGFIWLGFNIGLFVDLRRPLLTWSHPQQAMKQNMNVLLSMGLNLLCIGLAGAAVYGLVIAGMSSLAAGLVAAGAALAAAVLTWRPLVAYANESYGGRIAV